MNPFLGVIFHWLGGFASGSFYVPFRFVRKWSWEVYWLAGGFFSWIIAPWIAALILTKNLFPVLAEAMTKHPSAVGWAFLFGMMWGLGGLTFGLTMRYLGMSLGMAVALGYCTVFGTVMPPIFRGEFTSTVLGTTSGVVILLGVGVCILGIVTAAFAGMSKEREMSEDAKKAAIKEFSFIKGLLVATFSGIMSAGMSYGMAAAAPIGEISLAHGTDKIWTELPRLCVILAGGFVSNFLWCAFLFWKNGTGRQFFAAKIHETDNNAPAKGRRVPMFANYLFCAVAGTLWYFQFFFYSMGETKMGAYQFVSWPLHMASIMIFSSLWGIVLLEWKGSSAYTKAVLGLTLTTLIFSTVVMGYGTHIGKIAQENELRTTTKTVLQEIRFLTYSYDPYSGLGSTRLSLAPGLRRDGDPSLDSCIEQTLKVLYLAIETGIAERKPEAFENAKRALEAVDASAPLDDRQQGGLLGLDAALRELFDRTL